VKLDELIRTGIVQNSFVGIEHLSANELEELRALRGTREGLGRHAARERERGLRLR
jgi:low affinity Fe/Cu permease